MTETLPGDLILARTRKIVYAIGRAMTGNAYDHIAVVLHDAQTLNIVRPKPVMLPVSVFARPGRAALIVRPQWRSPDQREKFVMEMGTYAGKSYNVRKAVCGVLSTAVHAWMSVRIPLKKPEESASKWICTEAIIMGLFRAFPEFEAINHIRLDYNVLGFATTNDFLCISRRFPDLLQVMGPLIETGNSGAAGICR